MLESRVILGKSIEAALVSFKTASLSDASTRLLKALGYASEKTTNLGGDAETFLTSIAAFKPDLGAISRDKVFAERWRSCAFLFQLTNDEIPSLAMGQSLLVADANVVRTQIESFVFLAIELAGDQWSRTALAGIARELNRRFPMPAVLLFLHGDLFSLAVIDRRASLRDTTRDVVESKITVVKDVRIASPHRAHLDILSGLALSSLGELKQSVRPSNFQQLYEAWIGALSIQELNKSFYRELANWYFWATQTVRFPDGQEENKDVRNATSTIRLITRLIFIWFIKERDLVPQALFERDAIRSILKADPSQAPEESHYYKAILQNLFFATLNTSMGEKRRFRGKNKSGGQDSHFCIHNIYRHEDLFQSPVAALTLFKDVPFLNGGLFECLDKPVETDGRTTCLRVDGFSDRADNALHVPNKLFFADEFSLDLNEVFATTGRSYKTRGLIHILNSYKFTVDENTPVEEEVALDPELLGKVFESLLASYNPETSTTARKQTGSFYTPREIVDYMVDSSLMIHLTRALNPEVNSPSPESRRKLTSLLSYREEDPGFSDGQAAALIAAIDSIKILDPACGSGAFPMGMLLKLVHVLAKLDPRNREWKARQVDRVERLMREAEGFEDGEVRERVSADLRVQRADIEDAFERNELDYGRKLYLIENCIYGVDIQPIAVQIAKLRFFISLIVNETIDASRPNRGIRPLPNLETKFVAANSLIDIARPQQAAFSTHELEIRDVERALKRIRERHFHARTQETKDRCRSEDKAHRIKLSALLIADGFLPGVAAKLSAWDPYDQGKAAPFFDAQWMFEVDHGFDIVIGNPPYMRVQGLQQTQPEFVPLYRDRFQSAKGSFDIYALFVERGVELLGKNGQLAYIVPHKFFQASFGSALRKLLTDRQALREIVRFGAEQVFEEATTYTCLLFLTAWRQDEFDLLEVRSLAKGEDVLLAARQRALHPDYAFGKLAAPAGVDWDFALGEANSVLKRLQQHPQSLGDITRKIFQGIATSADKIFVLNLAEEKGDILRCYSKQLDAEIDIERGLTRPFLMGKDVHRYQPVRPRNVVIFPYWIRDGRAHLMKAEEIRKQFPQGWKYLVQNRDDLGSRERGRMHGEQFYAYIYPKNLIEFDAVKLMTPEIALGCQMALDEQGICYHTTKVYSFVFKPSATGSLKFYLGLLNSKVLWFFLSSTGYALRGGYFTFKTDYLKPFPIPDAPLVHQKLIESLVDFVLALKRESAEKAEDSARLPVMTAWFEQLIDACVYELYFPEEFAKGNCVSVALSATELPKLVKGEAPSITLESFFETTYAPAHPVRRAAFFIDTLPMVRVIEGKT
jgi:adenine-specific DNA-methyltransferase